MNILAVTAGAILLAGAGVGAVIGFNGGCPGGCPLGDSDTVVAAPAADAVAEDSAECTECMFGGALTESAPAAGSVAAEAVTTEALSSDVSGDADCSGGACGMDAAPAAESGGCPSMAASKADMDCEEPCETPCETACETVSECSGDKCDKTQPEN